MSVWAYCLCLPEEAQLQSHFQHCFSSSKVMDQKEGRRVGAMGLSICHHFTPVLVAFAATVSYHFAPALAGFAAFGCLCS